MNKYKLYVSANYDIVIECELTLNDLSTAMEQGKTITIENKTVNLANIVIIEKLD